MLEPIDSTLDIQPHIDHQVLNWELEPISEDNEPIQTFKLPELSAEQRRRIHNRSWVIQSELQTA
jgi:hypothetical protein